MYPMYAACLMYVCDFVPPEPPELGPINATLDPVPLVNDEATISASGCLKDFNSDDTHSANWVWDDGDTTPQENVTSPVTAEHIYTQPGVYELQLTVTDTADLSATELFKYVVVYNPEGGFVTGGGWIDSPEGAYKPDPTLSGKANFGFVSKYKKGATVPTGNTEFQFKAGDLNFHSSDYDWLVVTGSDYAQFKGVGTINGEREYKFMVWAGDNEPDTFRIKIWEEEDNESEVDIYDNGIDQPIGGGNIAVHKAKNK